MLAGIGVGSSTAGSAFAHISAPQVATVLFASASSDRMSAPMALTSTAKVIWRNAFAFGIFNRYLWAAPNLSWQVILGAMNMITTGVVERKITPQRQDKVTPLFHKFLFRLFFLFSRDCCAVPLPCGAVRWNTAHAYPSIAVSLAIFSLQLENSSTGSRI
jgi:hypothetical protein